MKTPLVLLFSLVLLLSCLDSQLNGLAGCDPGPDFSSCGPQVIIDEDLYESTDSSSRDSHITSVTLEGSCLNIGFSYGGCSKASTIELHASWFTLYSLPPQRSMGLWIEDTGDCEMLITDERTFDLTPLTISPGDTIILNLNGWSDRITYLN